jgi:hypothetical protein
MSFTHPVYGIPCPSCTQWLSPPVVSPKCQHHLHQRCFEVMCSQNQECPKCATPITEGVENRSLEELLRILNRLATKVIKRDLWITSTPEIGIKMPSFIPDLLEKALKKSEYEVVQLLLDNGLPVSTIENGISLFSAASRVGRLDIVLSLLKRSVKATMNDHVDCQSQLDSLLDQVVKRGENEILKHLLDQGISPSTLSWGFSLLYIACQHGQLQTASLLLERGASVNTRNVTRDPHNHPRWGEAHDETPMHAAMSRSGSNELVELLVQYGAPIDKT